MSKYLTREQKIDRIAQVTAVVTLGMLAGVFGITVWVFVQLLEMINLI